MRTALKSVMWCLFVTGLVGFGIALSELHVEWSVASLIAASVSGLVLLRIRADSHLDFEHDRMATG
ncbi:hypothetical protein G4H71_03375 [Rhodococcus triatomae]|uniref:Uncharacterized protein n=1 Tax=Rhodococcus triatomae TaxID=300028 RepID=A0A1G8MDJ9_9NOCA|nr:hypothetical protein [Rhodococcus triatomae]QNG18126.1 hypothetical protein G4H72_04670 [Rhodococcus triatomae]QNG22204.1 hypothetical protein G4H71_03375 [Rhodococcus triatomae]SDI66002.1 hypothetical protein SAMN05444695_109186 [Rhodococcus triatomae]